MFSTAANKKFIIIGLTASFSLLALYFGVLSLANSFAHAIEQFSDMWYWMLILVAGFGFQVGLYFYIRESIRQKQMKNPTVTVAASGGISTGSMVACCLHHLVDVLPILGLAALAVFLAQYQLFFIILGVLANIVGIIIMLEIIQKHQLSEGFLKRILVHNMTKAKKIAIIYSLILLLLVFFIINNQNITTIPTSAVVSSGIENRGEAAEVANLPTRTDSQGSVSFEVTPLGFDFDQPIRFEISIDTHSGALDFEMAKVSILEDNNDNQYEPLEWQGSLPGGHHRSGTLTFPRLDERTNKIKLIIQDSFLRIFEWELK